MTSPTLPPLTPMGTLRWSVVEARLRPLMPAARVLELGCGQGAVGARVAAAAGSWTGVEIDPGSAAVAAERTRAAGGTVVPSLDDLDPGSPADLLLAFEVLEHIEDDVAALTSWLKHLRPGGTVCVSVPAGPERFGPMDAAVGHFRRYRADQLADLLGAAGLVDVEVVHYGFPLGYALEAVRNRLAGRVAADPHDPTTPDGLSGTHGPGPEEPDADAEKAARTKASGRTFQPGAALGPLVRVAVAPFSRVQRLRPEQGTGLVATGSLPA